MIATGSPAVLGNLLLYAEKYSKGENVPLSVDFKQVNGGSREELLQLEEMVRVMSVEIHASVPML